MNTIFWLEKPEEKGPLKRPRHRWEDNTRMDLRETVWEDVDWMNVAQNSDQWWGCEHNNEDLGS
jgi:hypothetical protein